MNHEKTQDFMITTMQEGMHLIIARKKKHATSESILHSLMHMHAGYK